MAVQLILKNSSVQDREVTAGQVAIGEIALNYHESGPFLQCKDTLDRVWRIGGVIISADAPVGPSRGSWWFQPATGSMFFFEGTNWVEVGGGDGGGGGGSITNIIAGDGLTGGGNTATVTLNVGQGDGITISAAQVSVNAGVGLGFSGAGALDLQPAAETTLGGVIIGDGLNLTADGTISVEIPSPLLYRGAVDITQAPAGQVITPETAGDSYISTVNGNSDAGWTGIPAGTASTVGDLVVWNGTAWVLVLLLLLLFPLLLLLVLFLPWPLPLPLPFLQCLLLLLVLLLLRLLLLLLLRLLLFLLLLLPFPLLLLLFLPWPLPSAAALFCCVCSCLCCCFLCA